MGIPKFTSQVLYRKDKFGKRSPRYDKLFIYSLPADPCSFHIDFNGLIYETATDFFMLKDDEEYKEMTIKQLERKRQEIIDRKQKDPQLSEEEFIDKIIENLDNLVKIVDPVYLIYLAIDGSVPQAKMYQQRKRRLDHGPDTIRSLLFPGSAMVSPGTEFMFHLDFKLKQWISLFTADSAVQVIYSNHMVPGEGEHKIMEFMRKRGLVSYEQEFRQKYGKTPKHVFHGMDADLIFLNAVSNVDNVYLWRQDANMIININALRAGIRDEMKNPRSSVEDFFILNLFLGNDFLPCQPSLEDYSISVDALIAVYSDTGRKSLSDGNRINIANLINFIKQFSYRKVKKMIQTDVSQTNINVGQSPSSSLFPTLEEQFSGSAGQSPGAQQKASSISLSNPFAGFPTLQQEEVELRQEELLLHHESERQFYDNTSAKQTFPSYPLRYAVRESIEYIKQTNSRSNISSNVKTIFDMNKFVKAWYDYALNPMGATRQWVDQNIGNHFQEINTEMIEAMGINYIIGINWVYSYYKLGQDNIDWEYYYPYHFTPLFQQLSALNWNDIIKDRKIKLEMFIGVPERKVPANVLVQLLSILPLKYINYLPNEMWNLPRTHLADLYPVDRKYIAEDGLAKYDRGFPVIYDGKLNKHEGINVVPFIDRSRMENIFAKYVFLPPALIEKYTPQQPILFYIDPDSRSRFIELRYRKALARDRDRKRAGFETGFEQKSYIKGESGRGAGRGFKPKQDRGGGGRGQMGEQQPTQPIQPTQPGGQNSPFPTISGQGQQMGGQNVNSMFPILEQQLSSGQQGDQQRIFRPGSGQQGGGGRGQGRGQQGDQQRMFRPGSGQQGGSRDQGRGQQGDQRTFRPGSGQQGGGRGQGRGQQRQDNQYGQSGDQTSSGKSSVAILPTDSMLSYTIASEPGKMPTFKPI